MDPRLLSRHIEKASRKRTLNGAERLLILASDHGSFAHRSVWTVPTDSSKPPLLENVPPDEAIVESQILQHSSECVFAEALETKHDVEAAAVQGPIAVHVGEELGAVDEWDIVGEDHWEERACAETKRVLVFALPFEVVQPEL